MTKTEIKTTVLCFLFNENKAELLMIHKKTGQGAGKWNVPGGKVKFNESLDTAAYRECKEETGLMPLQLKEVGILEFYFPESNSWNNICHVFTACGFNGQLLSETEECTSAWVEISKIPYERMWHSDPFWIPLVLVEKPFHRIYHFDKNDNVREEKIIS